MAEAYKREKFLEMLEERREEGDFVDFEEKAVGELNSLPDDRRTRIKKR